MTSDEHRTCTFASVHAATIDPTPREAGDELREAAERMHDLIDQYPGATKAQLNH